MAPAADDFPAVCRTSSAIPDVAVNKLIPPVGCDLLQIAQVPRVGQLIEIDDRRRLIPHPLQNEVGPDKPRPPGHQNMILHGTAAPPGSQRLIVN
jgi:hypothetical protein